MKKTNSRRLIFDNEASFLDKKTGIKERTMIVAIRNNIIPIKHIARNDQDHDVLN